MVVDSATEYDVCCIAVLALAVRLIGVGKVLEAVSRLSDALAHMSKWSARVAEIQSIDGVVRDGAERQERRAYPRKFLTEVPS